MDAELREVLTVTDNKSISLSNTTVSYQARNLTHRSEFLLKKLIHRYPGLSRIP
uniref:Uncharacterized protein n=1 Tax=Physcomitrium patens TaxID=3218 RepID=A0A2K1L4D5_PHYPA|nr:hypothetical protein PHYPA_003691 [Physcomitrium patens]